MPFAGLTHRIIATFVDLVLLYAAIVAVALMANPLASPHESVGTTVLLAAAVAWFGVLPATRLQGTPGKRLMGIKITGMRGERLGVGRAMLRFVLMLATVASLGLGFLLAAWTSKRQALHDLGARTLVVARAASPEEVAQAVLPPTWWFNRALGLAAYAALLGIVWLVVDVRHEHEMRARCAAMIDAALPYRERVVAALREGRAIPPSPGPPGPHTRALYAKPGGTVVIEAADTLFPGGRVLFTPTGIPSNIQWRCSTENIERNFLVSPCRTP